MGVTGPASFGFVAQLSDVFSSCQFSRLKSIPHREANKLHNVGYIEVTTHLWWLSSKRGGVDYTRSKVISTNTHQPDFIR